MVSFVAETLPRLIYSALATNLTLEPYQYLPNPSPTDQGKIHQEIVESAIRVFLSIAAETFLFIDISLG